MSTSITLYCTKVSGCIVLCMKWSQCRSSACTSIYYVGCGYEELSFGLSFPVLLCSCLQSLLPQLFVVSSLSYSLHMAQHDSGRNLSATL